MIASVRHDAERVFKNKILAAELPAEVQPAPQRADFRNGLAVQPCVTVLALQPSPEPRDQPPVNAREGAAPHQRFHGQPCKLPGGAKGLIGKRGKRVKAVRIKIAVHQIIHKCNDIS